MVSSRLASVGMGTTSRSLSHAPRILREQWYVKYSWCDPGNRTATIPRRYLKIGSCFRSVQNVVSRTDARNASGLSGSKNADLIYLALYAGGIVGSSFHSAASGFPTGSAGFASTSIKAFSNSHANSASGVSGSSLTSTFVTGAVLLSSFGVTGLSSFFSLVGLGLRCREFEPCPRWWLSLPRRLCLFFPPFSRSLRRSRWSLGRA